MKDVSPEDILNTTRLISGIVIKPADFLAAAGVLATLYIATALANRFQLSQKDEKTRSFIENGVSNLSSVLCIYSLICMNFYFFQEDKGQLSFGEFIFYLAPAYIFHLISAYPPINTSKLGKRKDKNEENIKDLEGRLEEFNGDKTNSQKISSLARMLAGAKEFPRARAYLRFAKSRWVSHLLLIATTIPVITLSIIALLISAIAEGRFPIERIENIHWIAILILLSLYFMQALGLDTTYEYAVEKSKSEILGKKADNTDLKASLLCGFILFFVNLVIFSSLIVAILQSDNLEIHQIYILYAIIILQFLLTIANPFISRYIYKKYREYLQAEDMGEAFKLAVLEQALQDAKEEHDSLEKKIKEIQEPAFSSPSLPSVSGRRPALPRRRGPQPRAPRALRQQAYGRHESAPLHHECSRKLHLRVL